MAARLRRLRDAGGTAEQLLAALDQTPAHETAWALGADGEAAVGRVLDDCAQACGFAVLHDLTAPGSKANIDHVVVGPRGVGVIDTKAWTGPVRVTPRGLRIGGWSKRATLENLGGQVARISEVLSARDLHVPVEGFLCMANRNKGLPSQRVIRVGSLAVGTPEAVAGTVAQGHACSKPEADAVIAALCAHFATRGLTPAGDFVTLPHPPAPVHAPAPAPRHDLAVAMKPVRRRSRAPSQRKRSRHRRVLRELALKGVILVVGLLVLQSVMEQMARDTSVRLGAADVDRMLPALRAKAKAAAGGRVRGRGRSMTATQVHVRFRRGACRVVVHLDRASAQAASDATLTVGRHCPQR